MPGAPPAWQKSLGFLTESPQRSEMALCADVGGLRSVLIGSSTVN
jgi:hypothetical protein